MYCPPNVVLAFFYLRSCCCFIRILDVCVCVCFSSLGRLLGSMENAKRFLQLAEVLCYENAIKFMTLFIFSFFSSRSNILCSSFFMVGRLKAHDIEQYPSSSGLFMSCFCNPSSSSVVSSKSCLFDKFDPFFFLSFKSIQYIKRFYCSKKMCAQIRSK